jgi:hypothetical protein
VIWFETDVWGLPSGPIFKGQDGPLCNLDTNPLTPRNNPEDGRIQYNSGGSLRSLVEISVLLPAIFGPVAYQASLAMGTGDYFPGRKAAGT